MKKIILILLSILFLLLSALVGFYFWASSGQLGEQELSTLKENKIIFFANPKTDTAFTIVTYNIGYLSGMTNNLPVARSKQLFAENLKQVIDVFFVLRADIIAYQEIDFHAARSGYLQQSDSIASTLCYEYQADAVNWDKNYVPFPYAVNPGYHFGRVISGQAVHSHYPILTNERIVLEKVRNAPFYYNAFYLDRLAQVCKVRIKDRDLIVINVHLEAYDSETRIAQAKYLAGLYRKYAQDYPVLMVGDFNSHAPTEEYRKSAGYEETIDLLLREENLESACMEDNFSQKGFFTYPTNNPNEHIDYIFYTPKSIQLLGYRPLTELGISSDHLPVMARWRFK